MVLVFVIRRLLAWINTTIPEKRRVLRTPPRLCLSKVSATSLNTLTSERVVKNGIGYSQVSDLMVSKFAKF